MKIRIFSYKELREYSEFFEIYKFWYEIWAEAYKEDFSIASKLTSDNFLSQDLFILLENDNEYISLITLKYFNLSFESDRSLSYFGIWPENTILKLLQLGSHYFSCGNLSISKSYRGIKIDQSYSVKDIMFSAVREVLLSSSCDGVISNTRNLKSVNLAAYRTGAFPLVKDLDYSIKGQKVDLLMWHRDYLRAYNNPNLELFVKELTQEKDIELSLLSNNKENIYVNEQL